MPLRVALYWLSPRQVLQLTAGETREYLHMFRAGAPSSRLRSFCQRCVEMDQKRRPASSQHGGSRPTLAFVLRLDLIYFGRTMRDGADGGGAGSGTREPLRPPSEPLRAAAEHPKGWNTRRGGTSQGRLPALALSILVLASCHSRGNVIGDAAPPPSFFAKPGMESKRTKDDLWQHAISRDPMALARLADREGAGGLLEGLEEGGPLGLVALDALPFADDADAAYQRLGEIVRQIDPSECGPVVRAIAGIAGRGRRQTEPLDPPGLRSCAQALLGVAQTRSLAAGVRAQAISALRLLSEKGGVEPSAVPTDLDAR